MKSMLGLHRIRVCRWPWDKFGGLRASPLPILKHQGLKLHHYSAYLLFVYLFFFFFAYIFCLHCCLVAQMCLTLCGPHGFLCQAPLSMGFPRQEYWSWLSLPSPGDLPDQRNEPRSPALQAASLSGKYFSLHIFLMPLKVKVAQSCLTLCNPLNYTVHEFSRPEYWSG